MLYKILIENNLDFNNGILNDTKNEYTYELLHLASKNFSFQLEKKILKKGDHVLIINDNSIECVVAILACIAIGVVFIIVPSSTTEKKLSFIIKDSNAKLICANGQINLAHQNIPNIKFKIDTRNYQYRLEKNRNLIGKEDITYILYTSGSTTTPKGVVACQKQVVFCVNSIQERLENIENDIILNCLPLSFDFGLYQIFLALAFKSKLILLKKFISLQIPNCLKSYNITIFPMVPNMINLLMSSVDLSKYKFPDLRQINFTGDVLAISTIKKIKKILPLVDIRPMYGLTECKRVSIMPSGYFNKILEGSCGIPISGVDVKLINKNIEGIGELVVEGENVMEGYWNLERGANSEFGYNEKTKKKYIATGDLFKIDNEGFLYYKGRIKNIIKSNGYRISPIELEELLLEIPTIIQVKIIGVSNYLIGEEIWAYVYTEDSLIKEKIKKIINKWPKYQRLHNIVIVDKPLPTNINGKLDVLKLID